MSKNGNKKRLLLIFIKNPELGKVKTRLAATLGDKKGLIIYKKLLHRTLEVSQQLKLKKQLWYSDYIPKSDGWPVSQFQKKVQRGSGLGKRMQFAFEAGFKVGYKKIVIIGADCAKLQPRHIKKAFKALDNKEAVIGPATDGGYYLLGLKQFIPELFEEKSWGKHNVFDQTISDLKKKKVSFDVLEELHDIDTEEDWEKVKSRF